MSTSNVTDLQTDDEHENLTPPWRVVHLSYPRTTQEYPCIVLRWVSFWKIKCPLVFIEKKTLEKRETSVNYDLLCKRIESLLNKQEANGYELFSLSSTNSGLLSISHTPARPQHPFSKKRIPNATAQGEEMIVLIFRKKKL